MSDMANIKNLDVDKATYVTEYITDISLIVCMPKY